MRELSPWAELMFNMSVSFNDMKAASGCEPPVTTLGMGMGPRLIGLGGSARRSAACASGGGSEKKRLLTSD